MKIWENGVIREMTTAELSQIHKAELIEKSRSLSTEEVTAMLITSQINTMTVDDNTALRMKSFYPTFDSIVGQEHLFGERGVIRRMLVKSITTAKENQNQ